MSGQQQQPLLGQDPNSPILHRPPSGYDFSPNPRSRRLHKGNTRSHFLRQFIRFALHAYRILLFPLIGFFFFFSALRLYIAQRDLDDRRRRVREQINATAAAAQAGSGLGGAVAQQGGGNGGGGGAANGADDDISIISLASRNTSMLFEPTDTAEPGCGSKCTTLAATVITGGLFLPSRFHNTLPNRYDWVVIALIGAMFQIALFGPLYHFEGGAKREFSTDREKTRHAADFYGPIIFYPIVAVFFIWIGVAFNHYSRKERKARRELELGAQRQEDLLCVTEELVHIRASISSRSYLLVPWAAFVTAVEVVLIRVSYMRYTEFMILGTAFWYVFLFSLNLCLWFGANILYTQLKVLRTFTNDRERMDQLLRLEEGRENVARWALVWQGLVVDIRKQPLVRSITTPCGVLLILQIVATAIYIVLLNLYARGRNDVDVFMPGVLCVGIHAVLCFSTYIALTVSVQRTIEDTHKEISRLQNEVQRECEVFNEQERDYADLQMLRSKVRVLQSLDKFLAAADPRPRFLSLSLESLRWTAIIVGLLFINASFLLLYLSPEVRDCPKRTLAGNVTNTTM